MEILIFLALAAGASFIGHKIGYDQGKEVAYVGQRAILNIKFATQDGFISIYGVPGAYMSDINPHLAGAPLVIIQSSDFVKLVAISKEPRASGERIEQLVKELAHSSRLTSGLSEQDIKNLDSIFAKKYIDDRAQVTSAEVQPTLDAVAANQRNGASEAEATIITLFNQSKNSSSAPTQILTPASSSNKVTNLFGKEVAIDTRTEEEKREATRRNSERRMAAHDAEARNIDVESMLNTILLHLEQGESLRQAITSASSVQIRQRHKEGILSDIDQLKANGLTEPDAIRAALNSFSTTPK